MKEILSCENEELEGLDAANPIAPNDVAFFGGGKQISFKRCVYVRLERKMLS